MASIKSDLFGSLGEILRPVHMPPPSCYDVYRHYRRIGYTHGELMTAGIGTTAYLDRYQNELTPKPVSHD